MKEEAGEIGQLAEMSINNIYLRITIYIVFSAASGLIFMALWIWSLIPSENTMFVWKLRDGRLVRYYRQRDQSSTLTSDKIIDIIKNDEPEHAWKFADWHAGYERVELRADDTCSTIWLIDKGYNRRASPRLGCSIDLRTGSFVDEGGNHPKGVGVNSGRIIDDCEKVSLQP